jgi:hypothetical protein
MCLMEGQPLHISVNMLFTLSETSRFMSLRQRDPIIRDPNSSPGICLNQSG